MNKFKPSGVRLRCGPCKRAMSFCSYSRGDLQYHCNGCGGSASRETTDDEKRLWDIWQSIQSKEIDELHHPWHQFIKTFRSNNEWKYSGWEAMQKMERFMKRFPQVVEVGVDDDYFASSSLYFIPHSTKTDYMGTSVVYIPQCTGEDPIAFFLYEGHAKNLADVLKTLLRAHRTARGEARR